MFVVSGVECVMMMFDKFGISLMLFCSLNWECNFNYVFLVVEFVFMDVILIVEDMFIVVCFMQEVNVSVIIVFGGDGIYCVVVWELIDGVC